MADDNTKKQKQGVVAAVQPDLAVEADDPRDLAILVYELRQQNAELCGQNEELREQNAKLCRQNEELRGQLAAKRDILHEEYYMEEVRDIALRYLELADLEKMHTIPDFEDIPKILRGDEEFISSFLSAKPWWMAAMNEEMQVMFPHLVKQCIRDLVDRAERVRAAERAGDNGGEEETTKSLENPYSEESFAACVVEAVREEVWQDRDLVRAWFQAGGDFKKKTDFPEALRSDEEVFLWIAEQTDDPQQSFQHAAPELLANKDFMAKCIKFDRSLFRKADDKIKHDLDIVLLAFGGEEGHYPSRYDLYNGNINYRQFLHQQLANINDEMERDDAFFSTVLRQLAKGTTSSEALILHQDSIQLIASFAVPSETELRHLRIARANFQRRIQWELEEEREDEQFLELMRLRRRGEN